MIHKGDLIIKKGDNTDYSQLTEVTGNLYIYSDAKLDNLTTVGGNLYINSNAKLNNLTTVGDYLYIYSNAKLDNLTTVGGNLSINSDAKLNNLTTVGGGLSIYLDAKLEANNLTTVGGNLSIYSNAKLDNLTTVGGSLYIYSNAKLEAKFLTGLKWKSVDRNLFIIESTKPKGDIIIYKGYNVIGVKDNVIQREDCYVAESGKFYAHGKSMKKAVEDLQFKLISEKLKNEPINKDTVIDIKYYRLVTGACEFGVKSFIESNGLKESYKACDLLPILESNHAYGVEKFKSLLTF
jgi:hypothetical protein